MKCKLCGREEVKGVLEFEDENMCKSCVEAAQEEFDDIAREEALDEETL